jgi:hypothetical protein
VPRINPKNWKLIINQNQQECRMSYIDDSILYTDDSNQDDWQELLSQSRCKSRYWRRYAKKKMRRVAKELLRGIKPRIQQSVA